MFVPIYDKVGYRHIRRPIGVYCILAANIACFIFTSAMPAAKAELSFGMIPAVVFGEAVLPANVFHAPAYLTLFTSLFLHVDVEHIVGNMLFLWVFGDNIEDAMGTPRFILFYLLCGACAGMAHAIASPGSEAPLIGASGAVSGVIAAYLLLHPHVQVFAIVLKWIPVVLKASYVIVAWITLQFVYAIFGGDPNVGWWAHVGGIAAGAILIVIFKRSDVVLFDRALD
ncbi:MAG: rhomboid family intramembrane serine protease [Beijerinckiaceae bacterium]